MRWAKRCGFGNGKRKSLSVDDTGAPSHESRLLFEFKAIRVPCRSKSLLCGVPDLINDTDIRQRLNLVRTSNSFVLQEDGERGEANVLSIEVVPSASGVYWIAGKTIAKSGREIESVFRVDTDSGGTLISVFWWIDGNWYEHEDEDVPEALGLSRDEVFPFDWRFAVPLEKDIFHPA